MPDVRATIHRITEAAEAFLRNLEDPDQRAQATFPSTTTSGRTGTMSRVHGPVYHVGR